MNFEEGLKKVDEANQQIVEANGMVMDVISTTFIYSWKWWFCAALIVVPWVTWFFIRERKSTGRLLCAGLFIMIFSAVLDTIGIENGLWAYPVKVIPSPTLSFSFRLSVLPVLGMVFIQYKPRIHPFLKAVVYAGFAAFVGLPLLATIDLYKKINWQYSYSFGILLGMYLTAHSLYNLNSYDKVQPKAKKKTSSVNFDYFRRKQRAR
ncbi:CBO0543 family protein [Paenibacillus xanthanilyticus]|uniref:CBO0543 family protein n=1 Tax=Paenibacillus xanthanilyticus TaxID=1783531 RepID=A0ABV8JU96_9BACL